MKEALRVGIAVTAGVLLWGLLWNLGTAGLAGLFPADLAGVERIESTSLLLLMAAYSALLSSAVGWLAARIGGESAFIATLVLSVVNLAIGSLVQTIYWAMMPLWYHLLFLALILPATLLGGRLGTTSGAAARAALP